MEHKNPATVSDSYPEEKTCKYSSWISTAMNRLHLIFIEIRICVFDLSQSNAHSHPTKNYYATFLTVILQKKHGFNRHYLLILLLAHLDVSIELL